LDIGQVFFIILYNLYLRLVQTFAGVLQKKKRTRAVFKETPTNEITEPLALRVCKLELRGKAVVIVTSQAQTL